MLFSACADPDSVSTVGGGDGGNGATGADSPVSGTGGSEFVFGDGGTGTGGEIQVDAGPFCGNGIIDPELDEKCDDSNALGGDGCSGTCKMIEPNWICPAEGQPCISTVVCGNGTKDTGEGCDDNNMVSGDGCSDRCSIESGYTCPNPGQPCERLVNCGDGRISNGEGCDDLNNDPGDGCDAGCRVEEGWVCSYIAGQGSVCRRISVCGDGLVTEGEEECDDGNQIDGDCCSAFCRIEASFCSCPESGGECTNTARCGDGIVELGLATANETCDDGNNAGGDGCSDVCQVEPGYQCRQAGSPCVPDCGDGAIVGTEQCDDANEATGDGCSSTCLIEPGFACTGTPSTCTASVCGNSQVEPGESCDKGEDNGLFYGDGQGCSKTCTQEPNCRPDGTTQACSTTCGDGNHDAGEGCDDGNQVSGDGCSDQCVAEDGFTCEDVAVSDAEPCPSNPALQCLVLPVTYRDFEGQQTSGGHPDFFYLSAAASNGRQTGVLPGTNATTCVPNASGTLEVLPADGMCVGDTVGPCLGLVQDNLDANGKPVLANNTCRCRFTDWDETGILANANPDRCYAEGDGTNYDRIDAEVVVIQSAETFKQWYDNSVATPVHGTLELAEIGGNQYQFSSSVPDAVAGADGRTVQDDLHDYCLGDNRDGLTAGFFPLEDAQGLKLCNIWPYWVSGLSSNCCAGKGCPVGTQWDTQAAYYACPDEGDGGPVPSDYDNDPPVEGIKRNFYFTTEARYLFRYEGGQTLSFFGDDDVWVFVNGVLRLDLGAPHERLEGSVNINNTFGLEEGRIYEIAVFHADRHPRESNYQLTLSGFSTIQSQCTPRCGDGFVTAGEECDNGAENNDTLYGGCTTQCKYGPFCGDGNPDPEEECDDGVNTTVSGASGCAPGCKFPPACGNGQVDVGEQCDDGPANQDGVRGEVARCNTSCMLNPACGDGIPQPPEEECDDGMNIGGYGFCGENCVLGPRCGDGIIQQEFEQCDDGNTEDGDDCNADCGVPGYCGDAVQQPGEECDYGANTGEYGGCNADCSLAPYCGDGVVQENEECDYGEGLNTPPEAAEYGGCLISCQLGPHCGDGEPQLPYEECDDGNSNDDDSCTNTCRTNLR